MHDSPYAFVAIIACTIRFAWRWARYCPRLVFVKRGWKLVRNPVVLAMAFLVLLGVGTGWLLDSGGRGTDIATVLALTVAVLAAAAPIFAMCRRDGPNDFAALTAAARALARDVGGRESAEQQKFLADTGQGKPADVGFTQPELVYWRTDGGSRQGRLKDITDFHAGLGHGRLVILGDAGAGKTVLANQLLLDLISATPPGDPSPGTAMRVPVRLSLSSFDPGDDPGRSQADAISCRLDRWISRYLTDVHGVTPRTATVLVQRGWILPILDGLDEMDPSALDPIRAAAVIRGLNHPAGPGLRPVVITCRTSRYQQLATASAGPGRETVIQDATVVKIQPLTAGQVGAYLTYRFRDPAKPARIQPRWQPVLHHMTRHPQCPLASALSSPLRLFLATTAYYPPATSPGELTRLPDCESIDNRLLSQLIPVTASQHLSPDGAAYSPGDVTRWLTTLASHLRACQTREGGSGSDINLSELWTAAGGLAPRLVAATLHALFTALCLGLAGWYLLNVRNLVQPLPVIGVGMVILTLVFAWAMRERVTLSRLSLSRLSTTSGRRRLGIWLAGGLGGGLVAGLCLGGAARVIGYTDGLETWPVAGSALGITIGLLAGLRQRPSAVSHPRQVVTQGITHDLTVLLGSGLAGGLAFGLIAGLTGQLAAGLTTEAAANAAVAKTVAQAAANKMQTNSALQSAFASILSGSFGGHLTVGVAAGLTGGLALGLAVGTAASAGSPWLRYFVATRILGRRRELPRRPALFLDWAYGAGLLRLEGIWPQFRHRELQDYLASTPDPPGQQHSAMVSLTAEL